MKKDFLALINSVPGLGAGTLDGKPFFPPWDQPYVFDTTEIKQCLQFIYEEIDANKMAPAQIDDFVKRANTLFTDKINLLDVLQVDSVTQRELALGEIIMDCGYFTLRIKGHQETLLLRILLSVYQSTISAIEAKKYGYPHETETEIYSKFRKRLSEIKRGSRLKIHGKIKSRDFIGKGYLINGRSGFSDIFQLEVQGDFCAPSQSDMVIFHKR